MRRTALLAATVLLPLTACTACTAGSDDDQTLTVLAASSLTEVFTELGQEFERSHEGVEVRLSFAASTTLAEQAVQGAPGDVLATADAPSMEIAEEGGALSGQPRHFASNEMVVVVPRGNPAGIASVADLAGTDWVRCADEVPCGRVATALAEANDLTADPASLEVDVKSVLAKVTAGEADAGLVYSTDAEAAGDAVEVVEIPHSTEHLTAYSIAPLADARSANLASEFVELVTSGAGADALVAAGFGIRVSG